MGLQNGDMKVMICSSYPNTEKKDMWSVGANQIRTSGLRTQTSAFELMFALLVNHRRQDERLEKQRVNLSV